MKQALTITRNLKCKIYQNRIVIAEQTKEQKRIFKLSDVIVPVDELGI